MSIRVVVANEPRSYREVLVNVLRDRRPQMDIKAVEPEDLETEVGQLRPHLVVCSRAQVATQGGRVTWVTLYPEGENLAEVVTAGGRAMLVGIEFESLLAILDGTELRTRLGVEAAGKGRREDESGKGRASS